MQGKSIFSRLIVRVRLSALLNVPRTCLFLAISIRLSQVFAQLSVSVLRQQDEHRVAVSPRCLEPQEARLSTEPGLCLMRGTQPSKGATLWYFYALYPKNTSFIVWRFAGYLLLCHKNVAPYFFEEKSVSLMPICNLL